MKHFLLKIIHYVFGLFFVGVSLWSFTDVAHAYWSTSCSGGWVYTTSWTSPWVWWPGGYICASSYGCYSSPDCGDSPRYYSCTQTTTSTWNPNLNCANTWIPDPCSYNGLLSWGSGCSATGSWYAPNNQSVYVVNSAPNYTGSETYLCSNGSWIGPTNVSCNALVYPPSSVWVSSTVANPVYSDQTFTINWGQIGGTGTINYTLYVDYVGIPWGTATSWTNTAAVGNHIANVMACNSSGCATSPNIYINVINRPIPSTPSVSIAPSTIGLNQNISVSWGVSTNATRYEFKTDIDSTPVSMDGFANPWTGTSAGFTVGAHKIYIRGCNTTTNCGSWGEASFVIVTAPTITTFTTANNVFALPIGGGSVTLKWSSINTTGCVASNGWSGTKPTSGEVVVSVLSTKTYDLTCQ
jgi:hypothetical protein